MKRIFMCVVAANSLNAMDIEQIKEWSVWSDVPWQTLLHPASSTAQSSDDLTAEDSRSSTTTPSSSGLTSDTPQQRGYENVPTTCGGATTANIFVALGGKVKREMIEDENGCAYPSARSIILWENVQTQIYALAKADEATLEKVWGNLQRINALSPYNAADEYGDGKQYHSVSLSISVQNEFQLILSKLGVCKLLISRRGQHHYKGAYDTLLDEAKTWCGYAQFAGFSNYDIFAMCRNLALNVFSLDAIAPLNECLSMARQDRTIGVNKMQSALRSLANSHAFILSQGHCHQADREYHFTAGLLAAACLNDERTKKKVQEDIRSCVVRYPLGDLSNVTVHLNQRQKLVVGGCFYPLGYPIPGSTPSGWMVTSS